MKQLIDLDCKNKKIIVRVDLNVPVLEGTITDHSRIHAILPTLEKLIKNKNKVFTGVAASVDCNSRWVFLDPFRGTIAAVAESARNVSCVGACLLYTSPSPRD